MIRRAIHQRFWLTQSGIRETEQIAVTDATLYLFSPLIIMNMQAPKQSSTQYVCVHFRLICIAMFVEHFAMVFSQNPDAVIY